MLALIFLLKMAEQEVVKTPKKKKGFRFTIIAKTITMILLFSAVVVEIAMTYYSLVMSNRNKETYSYVTESLSGTVAEVVDLDDFLLVKGKVKSIFDTIPMEQRVTSESTDEAAQIAYMDHYAALETDADFQAAFNRLRDKLRKIVTANEKNNIDCTYLLYVEQYTETTGVWVYLVDSAPDEDACPPGWLDPVYSFNTGVFTAPEKGFPAYTTNTSYGYLMTAGSPIMQGTTVVGYSGVDINLNTIRAKQASSIVRLFAYLAITVGLIAIIGIVVVYFVFTRPMKQLNNTAKMFVEEEDVEKVHQKFVDLNIKTHDEIKDLSISMKEMEDSVYTKFNELIQLNQELTDAQKETERMKAIATRDSLTGVRSKTAYDFEVGEIENEIKEHRIVNFGIAMIDLNFLKTTNDEYGHDAGDGALIKLSQLICGTFAHSPVFRIGGDEFVVIVKDDDYRIASKLINTFKERIARTIRDKSLPEYERISAAIGYSTFDESKDVSVDEVFKRADKAMYDNKHEMKEE